MLARITRGLLRAAALEDRLRRRAARHRDIQPRGLHTRAPRKPRPARPTTSARGSAEEPYRPPTLEQIAAQDRCRPIGAILVDICLDLGIIPGQMDPASWNELGRDLALYGGDLANLVVWRRPTGSGRRPRNPRFLRVSIPGQTGLNFPPWPAPSRQSEASTGPP